VIKISILTLFPEMFPGSLACSIIGKALKEGAIELNIINIRDFAIDRRGSVDDKVFGGGAGMVIRADVLGPAIDSIYKEGARLIYPSPRGKLFNQAISVELSIEREIIIICGRYEGIDQRIIDKYNIEEISIGDFVLTGGEIAAMCMIDSFTRLIPGVIQNEDALTQESFTATAYGNLLEYPQYTRPSIWEGRKVPEVLISGHHQKIQEWKLEESLKITRERRPDLLK